MLFFIDRAMVSSERKQIISKTVVMRTNKKNTSPAGLSGKFAEHLFNTGHSFLFGLFFLDQFYYLLLSQYIYSWVVVPGTFLHPALESILPVL